MRMLKKAGFALFAFCLLICIAPKRAAAETGLRFSARTSGTGAIQVKKVTYEGEISNRFAFGAKGALSELEVDFCTDVAWKHSAKIFSIKDNKGKSYRGYLTDKDDDGCSIVIENMKHGRTYTIAVKGIRNLRLGSFGRLTLKVKVPARRNHIVVKKVEYDEDYESYGMEWKVKIEFNKDVQYKSSSYVIIRDSAGKAYSSKASYVEWEEDECEVHLNEGLKIGGSYTYEVGNVKSAGSKKFTTLKGSFRAYD